MESGVSLFAQLLFSFNSNRFSSITQSKVMETQKVAYNYHRWCLTNQTFESLGMDQLFSITAVNRDREGMDYISIIEHKKYPIFGVQFHPEKPQFEFILKKGHTK
jgi:gamma-glutamyl hydrolase